jgi:putative salt-induced outer membrane protein
MKLSRVVVVAAALWLVFLLKSSAQTNSVTVTNVVTVTITNTVTVTNVVTRLAPPLPVVALPLTNAVVKYPWNSPIPVVPTLALAPPVLLSLTNAVVKYPWNSSITAGLTLTRGNSDTLLAQTKFMTDRKTPANEYNFEADASYGSDSGVENNQTFHGTGQWNHLFSKRLYNYLHAEGLHDGIAEVKYRATVSDGLGYYLVKGPLTTLAGELGPGVVVQRVDGTSSTFATMRVGERFERKFHVDHTRFWQTAEYLPQLDKMSDYLINFEIGIEATLTKNMGLSVCLDDNFNSQPAPGRKRNDVKLISGITYKF